MTLARTTHGVEFDPADPSTVPPPWAVPAPAAPPPPRRKRETAAEASRRLGVPSATLYDRAKKRGVIKRGARGCGRPPKGREVRLSPEAWDSAAELMSPREIKERRAAGGAEDRATSTRLLMGVVVTLSDASEWVDVEDIVVAAWKKYPGHFGLAGYRAKHPCSHAVMWRLTDLATHGMLRSRKGRAYALTNAGRAMGEAWR